MHERGRGVVSYAARGEKNRRKLKGNREGIEKKMGREMLPVWISVFCGKR